MGSYLLVAYAGKRWSGRAMQAEPISIYEEILGDKEHAENVLINDTRFAIMGNDDGKAHFADVDLTKERSEIRLRFAPLA